jgi:lauroyl/myristoyl acyltransferase
LNPAVGENCASFAACFADLPTLNRRRPDARLPSIASVDGTDRLEAVVAAHRGVIQLTVRRGKWLNFFDARGVQYAAS